MADDPLRLRALAGHRIRASARFVDADRVVLRGLARIAHAVSFDGAPDGRLPGVPDGGVEGGRDGTALDPSWLVREVDAAIEDVVGHERVASSEGGDDLVPFDVLARPVGLDGRTLRVACDAFNARPFEERTAFFTLFVELRSLDAAAAACSTTPMEVARRARRALESMLAPAAEEAER